jgi:hypothetical protein
VSVDGTETGLAQFISDAGTQNSSAVQTQNGVNRGIVDKIGNQLICAVLSLGNTGLLEGNINIVIDMGVVGDKVALGNTQGDITLLNRQFHKLNHGRFLRFFLKITEKRKTFLYSRHKAFCRLLKNAFFDYTPQSI